ncbi:hypothetical protein SARC_01150 [Sphaeroforma arctica JP610]|uniref:Sec1 family domain-containing protein 2 n=1 Tax=Sphaeroforma arctica JP610 TaxID=667725 RepID=A0A0L0GCJ2_9EUKA|nr:hypothetical protein SARC_01150 [Sphaeroforma arctica JP610]KNC86730.1 hypothetical protein SARC_01150 [Sphaeroforma arctica JP610]|eukprot:XP_014160632.1 hypothetical protein SARC_01150 [Sphaeroforma arctica JP610]
MNGHLSNSDETGSVSTVLLNAWDTVLKEINGGSIVFMDTCASESLRWSGIGGGVCALLDGGAYSVLELQANEAFTKNSLGRDERAELYPNFQPAGHCVGLQGSKVVVVAGTSLSNVTHHLRAVLQSNKFGECVVLCGYDGKAHDMTTVKENYLQGLEIEIQEWLESGFESAEVNATIKDINTPCSLPEGSNMNQTDQRPQSDESRKAPAETNDWDVDDWNEENDGWSDGDSATTKTKGHTHTKRNEPDNNAWDNGADDWGKQSDGWDEDSSDASASTSEDATTHPAAHTHEDGWGSAEEVPIATVRYVPLLTVAPVRDSFFIPSFGGTIPSLIPSDVPSLSDYSIKKVNTGGKPLIDLEDLHTHKLPKQAQRSIRELGCALVEATESLRVKADVYSVGNVARLVAKECVKAQKLGVGAMHSPAAEHESEASGGHVRAGGYYSKASLVLVDRTLDIAGPILAADSIADLLLKTLSNITGKDCTSSLDVAVDISPALGVEKTSLSPTPDNDDDKEAHLRPSESAITGSIAHNSDSVVRDALSDLVYLRSRQALASLRNTLIQTIAAAKLPHKRGVAPSKVTHTHLQSLLKSFQQGGMTAIAKHYGLISLTLAVVESLTAPKSGAPKTGFAKATDTGINPPHIFQQNAVGSSEAFVAVAKEVLLSGLQPGDSHSLYAHMTQVVAANRLSVEEVLLCCILGASVLGPECITSTTEEKLFAATLLPVVMSHVTAPDSRNARGCATSVWLTQKIAERAKASGAAYHGQITEAMAKEWLSVCLKRVWGIANGRANLSMLQHVFSLDVSRYTQLPYRPLLAHLFEAMFEDQVDIPDLQLHQQAGFRKKLLTGFVKMYQASARPTDHKYIILFVIGGISASEMRYIRDIVDKFEGFKVLIGGTNWATPASIFEDTIGSMRYDGY